MTLFSRGQSIRTYRIALGRQSLGEKTREGDGRTPEGLYVINGRNQNSRFHLSLRIPYPNAVDRIRAKRLGVSPGGDIMIHGLPNGMGHIGPRHVNFDWTLGCIAVTELPSTISRGV